MQNVEMKVRGTKLTIVIDLAAKRTKSASGKTEVCASTRGNAKIPGDKNDDFRIGLNVYKLRNK